MSAKTDILNDVVQDIRRCDPGPYPIAFVSEPGRIILHCQVCGREDLTHRVYVSANRDELASIIRGHRHEPPKPMTPDERERIRVRGIHRRGAIRLAARGA